MPLDLTKPVMLKGGPVARYLGTLDRNSHPHIVAVQHIGGEVAAQFDNEGRSQDLRFTLINIPEPKRSGEVWVNIYQDGNRMVTSTWYDRRAADSVVLNTKRIACVRVSWTEGEGLEGK